MDINKLLKGNYKLPDEPEDATTKEKTETAGDELRKRFEDAARAKLKGSIAFVRKPGSDFIFNPKKKEEDKTGDKNE